MNMSAPTTTAHRGPIRTLSGGNLLETTSNAIPDKPKNTPVNGFADTQASALTERSGSPSKMPAMRFEGRVPNGRLRARTAK